MYYSANLLKTIRQAIEATMTMSNPTKPYKIFKDIEYVLLFSVEYIQNAYEAFETPKTINKLPLMSLTDGPDCLQLIRLKEKTAPSEQGRLMKFFYILFHVTSPLKEGKKLFGSARSIIR